MRTRLALRGLGALAVTLAIATAPSLARAQGDEAVQRFERGVQLYEAENYEGALVEFQSAYKISSNYKLLYNIAICQTALKDYAVATETFNRYLSEGGAEVSEARKADVKERLAKLALNVTRVKVTTDAPAGATLAVDDQTVGTTPLPESIAVKIGRRQFSLTANGRTVTKTVDINSGDQNAPINIVFAAVTTGTVDTSPGKAEAGPSFPIVWWGLTAALGVGTVVTGALAVGKRNDFERQQATYGVSKATLEDSRSSARTLGIVTDVLLVATVVGAGASTYFTIDYFKKKKKQDTGIYVTPFGVGYVRSF